MKIDKNNIQERLIKPTLAFLLAIIILMGDIAPAMAAKNSWDWLFPKAQFKGLNLGTIKQDNKLESLESDVKVDVRGKKYIEWTYTAKVSKEKNQAVGLVEPQEATIDRYFVTTQESGLGEAEIISVQKDGKYIQTPETSGTGSYNSFSSKKENIDISKEENFGTYVYKIKTPILEPRDYYVLDVNSLLKGKFKKGRTVDIGGVKRKLTKDETIEVNLAQRGYISADSYNGLREDRRDYIFTESSFDNYINTVGEYIDEDRISWSSSYINNDSFTSQVSFDLTPDNSQSPKTMKVYYLKPAKDGYEIDEKRTKTLEAGTTKIDIDDLPSGWIARAVLETEVRKDNNNPYKDHFLKNTPNTQLESVKAKLTIEKRWGRNVNASDKVDTRFTLKGGIFDALITIPKNQNGPTVYNFVSKFKVDGIDSTKWKRITYEVDEDIPDGFKLQYKAADNKNLKYIFENDKDAKSTPGTGGKKEECTAYGVKLLEPVEINQYGYEIKDSNSNRPIKWYGYGGKLKGKLRVPWDAGVGQSITLKLPDEIRFEHAVEDKPVIAFANKGKTIGHIYHEKGNILRFVFNENARASEDYDVDFEIGEWVGVPEGLIKVNGKRINTETTFGKQPIGIEANLNKFYDPNDQKAKKPLTKSLPFESRYYNYKGQAGSCQANILNIDTTVHFEDEEIAHNVRHLNKYVVEEGPDYIIWESVYNSKNDRLRLRDVEFYDFLGITNMLYHGNDPSSLIKDVELYISNAGTVSGSYVKGTEKQIYPRGGNAEVTSFKHNGKIENTSFKKVYQLQYKVRNLGTNALIARVKTKKLAPLADGDPTNPHTPKHYYNHIQSVQSSIDKDATIKTYRYAPKIGRAGTTSQGIYDVYLQKTEFDKGKEIPLLNNSCEFMANKVDGMQSLKAKADKQGRIFFKGLMAGDFIVQEITPPTGYSAFKQTFAIRVKPDSSAQGEVGDKIKYKTYYYKGPKHYKDLVSTDWIEIKGNNLPTIPNVASPGLKVIKVDAITGKPISGAKFRLVKQSEIGDGNIYDQTIGEGGLSEFVFASLVQGEYTLEEIEAPKGYEKAGEILLSVYQDANGRAYIKRRLGSYQDAPEEDLIREKGYYTIKVPNPRSSNITIKKFDIYGSPIISSEAKFDLYAEDTGKAANEVGGFDFTFTKENSDLRYSKKTYKFEDGSTMQARLANGVLVTKASVHPKEALEWAATPEKNLADGSLNYRDLPDGRYFIMETNPPIAYQKLQYPIPFTIENGALKGNFPGYLPILNKKDGEFSIEKTNQTGKKLEGIDFSLFNKDGNGNEAGLKEKKTTDRNGHITFSNLQKGNYILKETKPPKGYEPEGPWEVYVDEDGKTSVVDPEGKNIIKIRYLNKTDINKVPVAEIINAKKFNIVIRKRDKFEVEEFIKSQGGEDPEYANKLAEWQKSYNTQKEYWKQLLDAAVFPEDYIKTLEEEWLKNNPKPVSQSGINDVTNFDGKLHNDKVFTILRAKFELLKADGNSFNPEKIGETSVGTSGLLKFENLRPGSYILREIEGPEEYLGLKEDYPFTITEDGRITSSVDSKDVVKDIPPSNDGKDLNLVIKNKKAKYKIRLKKIDFTTGEIIKNAKRQARLRILDKDKKDIEGQVATLNNEGYFEFDNKGNYFKPGIYYIKEEITPQDAFGREYSFINPNPIGIKLKSDGSIELLDKETENIVIWGGLTEELATSNKASDGTVEVKIANAFTKDFRISKRNQNGQLLKGGKVSFKLTNNQTKTVYKKIDQDATKDIVFSGLFPGTYTLEEIKSPSGYIKEDKTYKVLVDEDGANIYKETEIEAQTSLKLVKSSHFSRPQSSNKEANALDRDERTYAIWGGFSGPGNDNLPVGAYIGVDLGSEKMVESFFVNMGHPNNWNDKFDDFALEYSSDGSSYKTFKTYRKEDGINTVQETMSVKARYIRLRNLSQKRTWIGIQDFFINAKSIIIEENANGSYIVRNSENPNFKFIKVDKNGRSIENANAKFEIRRVEDDILSSEGLNESSGKLVYKLNIINGRIEFLDENNSVIEGTRLPLNEYGKYILVEKEAPSGYKKLEKVILLDFDEGSIFINQKLLKVPRLTITDKESKKYAEISEVDGLLTLKLKNFKDSDGEFAISKRIKGLESLTDKFIKNEVEFRLTKDDDANFKMIKKTGADNNIVFDGLKKGTYTLEESKAPEGYVRENKSYKVVVEKGGNVNIYDIDKKVQGNPKNIVLELDNLIESTQLKNAHMNGDRTRDKIFDSNDDTVGQYKLGNSTIDKDTFIGVDLKGYYEISNIRFVQNPDGKGGNDKFDKAILEYSIDGKDYKEIQRFDQAPKEISKDGLNLRARYVRLRNLEQATGRWLIINSISIKGRSLSIKEIKDSTNNDINSEENLLKIGNIQNPALILEKLGEDGKQIKQNNKGKAYNAKFKLYKVSDNKTSLAKDELDKINKNQGLEGFKFVGEYSLNAGSIESVQACDMLGRYVLVETEAPDGYEKAEAIFMDLVETQQPHSGTLKKNTSAWKLVGDTKTYQKEDGLTKFEGSSTIKHVNVDYSLLHKNKITIKIKDKKKKSGLLKFKKTIKVEGRDQSLVFKKEDNLRVGFKLTKENDPTFKAQTIEKGAEEVFEFKGLGVGSYLLEETLAPVGYIRKKTPFKVFVDENANVGLVEKSEEKKKIELNSSMVFLSERLKNRNFVYGNLDSIFDGNEDSGVQINMDQSIIKNGDYVGIDLKALYHIDDIRFCHGPRPEDTVAGNDAFDKMVIEYSIDGKNYYKIPEEFINENIGKSPVGKLGRPNTNANIEKTGQNILARYIRFRNIEDAHNRWLILREIIFKGGKVGNPHQQEEKISYENFVGYFDGKNNDISEEILNVPNLQNPHIYLEKLDEKGKLIDQNNTTNEYNAKFVLYKVKDDRTQVGKNEALTATNGFIRKQEFVLKNGKLEENIDVKKQVGNDSYNLNVVNQELDTLGRYVLVEEESPDGYEPMKPVLLDLIEVKQEKQQGFSSHIYTTAWKFIDDNTQNFTGEKEKENVIIDYKNLGKRNSLTRKSIIGIKVKDKRPKASFIISKRIKGLLGLDLIKDDKYQAIFKLTKDGDTSFSPIIKEGKVKDRFKFENLDIGSYTLTEEKAPEGYVKEEKPYKIGVDRKGGIHLYKEIENETEKLLGKNEINLTRTITNIVRDEDKALDGDESTQAIYEPQYSVIENGHYLQANLNGVYKLNSLKFIQDKNSSGGNDAFDKLEIEYSIDGNTFTSLKVYENRTKTGNRKPNTILNIIEKDLNIYAKYVRFKSLERSTSRWLRVNEIALEGVKIEHLSYLSKEDQAENKLWKEENLVKIGNIQNPFLIIEKLDKETGNRIEKNNEGKDFNAKFKLYRSLDKDLIKVDANTNFNDGRKFAFVQEFTLNEGINLTSGETQKQDVLGRYVLVETEAPDGYEKINPIIMDLVETRQDHNESLKKNTTSWKILADDTSYNKEEGYIKFDGIKDLEDVRVDYSKLKENIIRLGVKNASTSQKIKIKIKKLDKSGNYIKGNNSSSARFFISLDGKNIFNGQAANLNEGYFTFGENNKEFSSGLYYLVEEKAPEGYIKLREAIPFYIEKTGEIIIPAKEKTPGKGEYEVDNDHKYKNKIKVQKIDQEKVVTIEVINKKPLFPDTGGRGTLIITLLGTIIMLGSVIFYIKKRDL